MAPTPPLAARRPHSLHEHGDKRVDDWYWLRERENPDVIRYLEAENEYAAAMLEPSHALQERIFEEIRGRVQETDESAPVPYGPWEYTSRSVEGLQYDSHYRRPLGASAETAVLLIDENELARDHDFFALGGFEVSPDHNVLAYTTDTDGGERYTLRFRDLAAGTELVDVIEDVYYGLAWAEDSRTCFYTRPDDAMRPHEVWRHTIGTSARDDVLVLREDDERFFLSIERTRSGRFILITADSRTTTEVWFVPTDDVAAAPHSVGEREAGHEYSVEHHRNDDAGDRFLIVTNQGGKARNFELDAAPCANPARENWTPLVPHDEDVKLDAVSAFAGHIALSERANGLERLRVMRVNDGDIHEIAVPDPVYTIWVGPNEEYETRTLRYGYSSLIAPPSSFDYDLGTRATTLVKQQPVLGGYDSSHYTSERLWATATDGTHIPISLVRRRDIPLDGSAPALLYGYGSYESSIEPDFRSRRLSLLDRGFVYAIAHVRGGGEMGREWYEAGRLEHKTNTFTDFVACAEHLIANSVCAPDRLAARGASAGGLLMGAVSNLRPDLFAVVVAEVPFVDVVTTMLDASLPLTITEWEEWGDPREPDAYARMKSYSPYDNVRATAYPAMLVTTGLNDPRVQYWEPAKWVAKLRVENTSGRAILLKTELDSGHAGPSGRYDAWREEALVLSFVCAELGITQ